jgi:hypothetical protein
MNPNIAQPEQQLTQPPTPEIQTPQPIIPPTPEQIQPVNKSLFMIYKWFVLEIAAIILLIVLGGGFILVRDLMKNNQQQGIAKVSQTSSSNTGGFLNSLTNSLSGNVKTETVSSHTSRQTLLATIPDQYTKIPDYIMNVQFSKDGKKVAYVMDLPNTKARTTDVYINNDKVDSSGVTYGFGFSADGKRYAYDRSNEIFTTEYVVDGKVTQYKTGTRNLWTFSPDGKSFLYAVCSGFVYPNYKTGESFLVLNEKKLDYQGGCAPNFKFSPDSSKLAYATGDKDGLFVVENGTKGKSYPTTSGSSTIGTLYYSPDSKNLAYTVSLDKVGSYLVKNGVEIKSYPDFSALFGSFMVFSPNSSKLAYVLNSKEGQQLIINDHSDLVFSRVESPIFSPDSKHYAYMGLTLNNGNSGKKDLILDGNKLTSTTDNSEVTMLSSFFSPNSQNYAYFITQFDPKALFGDFHNTSNTLVVNQNKYPAYIYGSPSTGFLINYLGFSPNNKVLAYVGSNSQNKKFIVLNNNKGKEYDEIYQYSIAFSPDSKSIMYGARINRNIYWVVDSIPDEVSNNNFFKLKY